MAANGRGHMRPNTGGKSPPFIVIGLLVVIGILAFNYWSLSSKNNTLSSEVDEVGMKYRSIQAKKLDVEKRNAELSSLLAEAEKYKNEATEKGQKLDAAAQKEQELQAKIDGIAGELEVEKHHAQSCDDEVGFCRENITKLVIANKKMLDEAYQQCELKADEAKASAQKHASDLQEACHAAVTEMRLVVLRAVQQVFGTKAIVLLQKQSQLDVSGIDLTVMMGPDLQQEKEPVKMEQAKEEKVEEKKESENKDTLIPQGLPPQSNDLAHAAQNGYQVAPPVQQEGLRVQQAPGYQPLQGGQDSDSQAQGVGVQQGQYVQDAQQQRVQRSTYADPQANQALAMRGEEENQMVGMNVPVVKNDLELGAKGLQDSRAMGLDLQPAVNINAQQQFRNENADLEQSNGIQMQPADGRDEQGAHSVNSPAAQESDGLHGDQVGAVRDHAIQAQPLIDGAAPAGQPIVQERSRDGAMVVDQLPGDAYRRAEVQGDNKEIGDQHRSDGYDQGDPKPGSRYGQVDQGDAYIQADQHRAPLGQQDDQAVYLSRDQDQAPIGQVGEEEDGDTRLKFEEFDADQDQLNDISQDEKIIEKMRQQQLQDHY